jgi:TIR domain
MSSRRIFLSYRREDTAPYARLLQDQLKRRIPDAEVFADLDSVEPGADFAEIIREAVGSCAVLVVLIGREWLTPVDEGGRRRLDYPDDYVRVEVQTALERGVRVVPVLIDGARPLQGQELPPELRELARLNARELSYGRYKEEVDQLLDLIREMLAEGSDVRPTVVADPSTPKSREQQRYAKQAPQLHRPKIFLCYRREDTQGFARGIYESLANKYGHEQIFRDIDSTPAGVRFSAWIESRVGQCNVMMVLIGNSWASARDHTGQRRLDLPKDWVRQEIETALRRDIPIIPVRVQGAPMPSEDELPPSIADLTSFQSAEVADSRWAFDMGLLIQAIDDLTSPTEGVGVEMKQHVGHRNLTALVPRVVAQTEQPRTQSPGVEVDWNYYRARLSPGRFALVRGLYERIEKAIKERELGWTPKLVSSYFAFQRPGGYNCVGVDIRSTHPVDFWIKLPLGPDELRRLDHNIRDPYPELEGKWHAGYKQWNWAVLTLETVPDVAPAIELTSRYQPPSGPMRIPTG